MEGGWWLSFCALGLPLLVAGGYAVVTGLILSPEQLPAFHAETGPVETVTAVVMLATAGAAALLALKLRRNAAAPRRWQVWYLLIAAGALFVFMEEISYGQHWFGWTSPAYFQEHNKQRELNLHNLYGDALSSSMRKAVNVGLPLGVLVLPLVFMRRPNTYRPGHWTWYALPRLDLAVWVLLAALLSPIRKLGGFTGEGNWAGSLSELKELMWACALLMYVAVMWRRLLGAGRRAVAGPDDAAAGVASEHASREGRGAA